MNLLVQNQAHCSINEITVINIVIIITSLKPHFFSLFPYSCLANQRISLIYLVVSFCSSLSIICIILPQEVVTEPSCKIT